jgi:DNA mismatch repair protein MutL
VVAEGPAGLYLIDQHAAHQRVLFEMLSDQVMAGKPLAQHTLSGATVELPAAAARALEAVLEELAETGFELELFGGNTFRVRAVPVVLVDVEPAYALRALVEDLQAVEDAEMSLLELVLRRVSALAAYKAGQVLSFDDMQRMVQALERCQSPRVDLFGRPTLLHISGEELARQFGRR